VNKELSGKRAVVCGSTQGIGWACAVEVARLGAGMTLVARDEQALRNTVGDLPTDTGQTHHAGDGEACLNDSPTGLGR
jgi:3-oxoacyl-[acyl-carrier protein] reductase